MALLVHGLGSFGPRSGFQKALIRRLKNPPPTNGSDSADRNISGVANSSNLFGKVVYPDTSRMVIYDPRQTPRPYPDGDFVLSICLQSNIPLATGKSIQQLPAGPVPSPGDLSGLSKLKQIRDRRTGKRKDSESMSLQLDTTHYA